MSFRSRPGYSGLVSELSSEELAQSRDLVWSFQTDSATPKQGTGLAPCAGGGCAGGGCAPGRGFEPRMTSAGMAEAGGAAGGGRRRFRPPPTEAGGGDSKAEAAVKRERLAKRAAASKGVHSGLVPASRGRGWRSGGTQPCPAPSAPNAAMSGPRE